VYALPRRLTTESAVGICHRSWFRLGRPSQPGSPSAAISDPCSPCVEPVAARTLSSGDHAFDQRTYVPLSLPGDRERSRRTSRENRTMQQRLISMVLWYQRAFQWRPSPCRFTPSCSNYAIDALHVHGAGRGLWLTARRLLRCRPFGPSGFDPVPEPHDHSHHVELT
jgi:putative membrane protein insertion efficiency factor